MTWHVDPALLDLYGVGPLPPSQQASVEAHLTTCPTCRDALARRMPRAPLDAAWDVIVDRLDAAPPPVARGLTRLGVREDTARLVAGGGGMRTPWWFAVLGVIAVVAFSAAVGGPRRESLLFLALAPLAPLGAVALAYAPVIDRRLEVAIATPYSAFRLLALRATVACTSTTVALVILGLLAPIPTADALRCVLPAALLAACAFALLGRLPVAPSIVLIGAAWLAFVTAATRRTGDVLAAFQWQPQLLYAVGLLAALAFAMSNRQRFDLPRELA